ncbi:HisA/HisF-related TIM barrel protein [Streptomyces sp. NPDC051921]|uniref:HisA/HisF-related TIM barrel protein n=1 Tax=Streptomyces sp. NPDC051921 TaxID=3155806 RepID=UPI003428ED4A
MDFVFMLTRDDRTVTDCLHVLDSVRDLGITHIGFKDVGVDPATLRRLHEQIRALGATSHLEVVSTGRDQALDSVRTAVELGVDWLMGGTWVAETLDLLAGTPVRYLPFVGEPEGRPTRLAGDTARIAEDCRRAEAAGCAGVDLLAHRATEADPLALVRAARAATAGRLVVAGSLTTATQIRALAEAGVDAFTVGSAVFAGAVRPDAGTLAAQLTAVTEASGGGRRRRARET